MERACVQCEVTSCEKVRKGCWRLSLSLRWRTNGQRWVAQGSKVEVNRPWPVGEVMEFRLGDGLPEVCLTAVPEEL